MTRSIPITINSPVGSIFSVLIHFNDQRKRKFDKINTVFYTNSDSHLMNKGKEKKRNKAGSGKNELTNK